MFDSIDRRQFLGQAAAGSAAIGAALTSLSARAADAPSQTVVVGVMGLSRGRELSERFAAEPGVIVKYVCDVDSVRAGSAADSLQRSGHKTQPIGNFQQILDDDEVDALVCAAPNHWHAPATILACKAGKHVYVEKPCSHNPWEGETMVQAARKYNRAVQMGSQRRSGPAYQQVVQMLRDGAIGRVYCVRSYYNNARGPIGAGKPAPVPANLNYELWQGPAPRKEYVDNRVPYNWHWFWHWGNGELGNNGVHSLDICRWGAGVDFPIRVTSSGGRYRFDDDQETPDTHTVTFEFPGEVQITWQGLSCNRHTHDFACFYGEEGTLAIDGGGNWVQYDARDKEVKKEKNSRGDQEHIHNFVTAIREDKPLSLNAEIAEGHKSTLLCHLGNIAYRVNRVLNCNVKDGHIEGDAEAMKLWKREYEPGWEPTL